MNLRSPSKDTETDPVVHEVAEEMEVAGEETEEDGEETEKGTEEDAPDVRRREEKEEDATLVKREGGG